MSDVSTYEQSAEKRVEANGHFWRALEEYQLYLRGKYGSEWFDSMLDESERLIISGLREVSLRDSMWKIN